MVTVVVELCSLQTTYFKVPLEYVEKPNYLLNLKKSPKSIPQIQPNTFQKANVAMALNLCLQVNVTGSEFLKA